jgi:sodium transport system permease protein
MIASERGLDGQVVHVGGMAHAPGLARHLEAAGIVLRPAAGSPEDLLARAPGALVLVVPPGAPAALAQGGEARVELWADMADPESRRRAQHVGGLVSAYGSQLAEQRLLGAGVKPASAGALALEVRDMSGAAGKASLIVGLLPLFWLLGLFIGGSHVALDTNAGERERRSLESLLAEPVAPGALFVGKWLVASSFAFASGVAALLLSVLVLERLPLHEIGVAFAPDAPMLLRMLLVMLPLALLVGAIQCVAALQARTHKEAQIYLNLLQLLPMVLAVEQIDRASPAAAHLVPLLSQHAQLNALLTGQAIAPLALGLSLAGCAGAAALLVWRGSRRLGSERFVFGL